MLGATCTRVGLKIARGPRPRVMVLGLFVYCDAMYWSKSLS